MKTTSFEEASQGLALLKRSAPYRKWYAIEINGEWLNFDSMRKVKAAMRKAGILQANILSAQ